VILRKSNTMLLSLKIRRLLRTKFLLLKVGVIRYDSKNRENPKKVLLEA
jgi:hypothetical protein